MKVLDGLIAWHDGWFGGIDLRRHELFYGGGTGKFCLVSSDMRQAMGCRSSLSRGALVWFSRFPHKTRISHLGRY